MSHIETNDISEQLKEINVLMRVNNLLISRFILELATIKKDLGIPKRQTFFRFELLDEEYRQLIEEFGEQQTNRALYRLDRLLLLNKQQCPHNIAKYIRRKLKASKKRIDEKRKIEHPDS